MTSRGAVRRRCGPGSCAPIGRQVDVGVALVQHGAGAGPRGLAGCFGPVWIVSGWPAKRLVSLIILRSWKRVLNHVLCSRPCLKQTNNQTTTMFMCVSDLFCFLRQSYSAALDRLELAMLASNSHLICPPLPPEC